MTSGIYVVLNTVNGKVYVGSSINVHSRLADHRISLARGRHTNPHLQSAWNRYGPSVFSFDVLEECSERMLLEREQHHIALYNSMDQKYGYNKREAGPRGRPSLETRMKMSIAQQGHSFSADARAKMSAAQKGNQKALGCTRSMETRAKIGAAHRGKKRGPLTFDHRAAIGIGNRRASQRPEVQANRRAAHLGKRHTPESRAKIGAFNLGKKRTAETRAKMSVAHMGNTNLLGYHHTPEARAKMSASKLGMPWSQVRRAAQR